MTNENAPSPAHIHAITQSRGWLIFGGIISILVGFFAMGSPMLFSAVIVQFLGIIALVSGLISLFLAIFGKHVGHRVLDAFLALIRIAAGIVLLWCVASSIAMITLILAVFLIIEGFFVIIGAFKIRGHNGWIWTLINGIAALVLGIIIYARWPWDSWPIIGLVYGINSLFWGMSLLMLGLGAKPQPAA
jgi:uncharacterized membrane protein HdeD (DUF308 family)